MYPSRTFCLHKRLLLLQLANVSGCVQFDGSLFGAFGRAVVVLVVSLVKLAQPGCIWFGHWSSLMSRSACLLNLFLLCFRGFERQLVFLKSNFPAMYQETQH